MSPEPVLAPEIAALARAVADRYAGGMIDVLRLAIPPGPREAAAGEPAPLPQDPAGGAVDRGGGLAGGRTRRHRCERGSERRDRHRSGHGRTCRAHRHR
ncbi:hypothetical protein BBK82_45805 [Lentzea guizhouensis]|uniref:Uncharacterized protein n=1 Tax=Lentzea guizhouensis TaxID=1586287 RepID=A0A1B2HWT2_9PSEU|nr:hypothetical protein BBK82_45805 [Lentzea guizhouensis]